MTGKEMPIDIAVANKPPGVLLSTPSLVGRSNTFCGIANRDTPPLILLKSLKDQIIDANRSALNCTISKEARKKKLKVFSSSIRLRKARGLRVNQHLSLNSKERSLTFLMP